MSRYNVPRRCISWKRNDDLKVMKMLAHVLWANEADCHTMMHLWERMDKVYPTISLAVLQVTKTFKQVRAETYREQGIKITPNRLIHRADKTERNQEFNLFHDCVEAAYRVYRGKPVKPKDSRGPRNFSNEQLRQRAELQNWKCFYCGEPLTPESLEGDHIIPWVDGGPTEVFNCAVASVRCNRAKGAMNVFEYGRLCGRTEARGRRLKGGKQ